MMGEPYMNGSLQAPGAPVAASMDTPVAYYQPIAITPGTIKWIAGMIGGVMIFLAGSPMAEKYLNPAKQSDLVVMQEIVKTLQIGQTEQRDALQRLTMAVDNLSGIVAGMQQTARAVVPRVKSLAIGR